MELLAFGGGSLVWNPRSRVSIDAVHDHYGNCRVLTARGRRNPLGVSVVDRRRRGGSAVGARKAVEARGYNVQDDYNSASETAPSSMNQ